MLVTPALWPIVSLTRPGDEPSEKTQRPGEVHTRKYRHEPRPQVPFPAHPRQIRRYAEVAGQIPSEHREEDRPGDVSGQRERTDADEDDQECRRNGLPPGRQPAVLQEVSGPCAAVAKIQPAQASEGLPGIVSRADLRVQVHPTTAVTNALVDVRILAEHGR